MKDIVIKVTELRKSFQSAKALDGITFEISKGEVFGYLGHNGSGKTTTMRLILGLLKPDSGSVSLLGENPYPDSSPQQTLRRRIGVLLEKDALYPNMTGWENLAYWAQLYGLRGKDVAKHVSEAIDLVCIGERSHSLTGTYSKGMRRQLAIARALLCHPEVLFLDEPTNGLDPVARVHIRAILEGLVSSGKCTIFLSSHDLDEVEKLCNRVLIIEKGKKVISGTVTQLRTSHPELVIQLKPYNECFLANSLRHKLEELPIIQNLELRGDMLYLKIADYDNTSDVISFMSINGALIRDIKHNTRSLEDVYYDTMHHIET